MSRADLLVISNGHGEDAIGAALVTALRRRLPALTVGAFPLVGEGPAYRSDDLVGPRSSLPAGGLTLHHPTLLLADLRAGIVGLTVRQVGFLRRQRPSAVLVVGDAYAQALAALVSAPRAVLQPLVSVLQERPLAAKRLNRYFMESIRAPERLLLTAARRVYARDEPTATALRARGVTSATYLGNPIMDGLAAAPLVARSGWAPGDNGARDAVGHHAVVIALLPGSRAYATTSVRLMVEAVDRLSGSLEPDATVTALVAWTGREVPPPAFGWRSSAAGPVGGDSAGGQVAGGNAAGTLDVWTKGRATVRWERGGFAAVLAAAEAVIGTAGTANEQAAGLGLPVVAFAVPPYYGAAFLENQERLLGGALHVVPGRPADIAAAVRAALLDGPHRDAARAVGPARLGGPGGTEAVADDLVEWLRELGLNRSDDRGR